ncbi:MAG: energy transducer TonB [Pseudomonadales bacterium]|jgi:hypothetical protein
MNQKIIALVAVLVLIGGYVVFSGDAGDQNEESAPMTQTHDSSSAEPAEAPVMAGSEMTSESAPEPEAEPAMEPTMAPAPVPMTEPAHPEYTDDGYPWNEELRPLNPSKPGYPISARREGVEGDVVATFVVNTDGSTANCAIESAMDVAGEEIRDFNWTVCETVDGYQYPEIAEAKETKIKFHYRLDDE